MDQNPLPKLKIIVADDHKLFRDGLVATLKLSRTVAQVAQAADGIEVLEQLHHSNATADIVFMDINMPNMDGIETTREIKLRHPQVKVIALSMHEDQKHVIAMFEAGASAYLLKNTNRKEIATAIEEVMAGKQFYGKGVSGALLDEALNRFRSKDDNDAEVNLLPKEEELLRLIYQEFSTKAIAERMQVSSRTIEGYRQSLFQKTKTQNLTGLIKFAIRNGYTGS